VLTYYSFEELYTLLLDKPKPLALYILSENKKHVRELTERLQYGGGCINDCVIHLATSEMGFGGVGESGMGAYHGKRGFDAFSHHKSIVDKSTKIDPEPRYQPYRGGLSWKLMRMFLK
jgi:aldehyde dehydrogenase (NAD+)